MRIHTMWWEYCSNCSIRVEAPETDNPTETELNCSNCGKREIVDITSETREN